MMSNRSKQKKSLPLPQLARPIYSVHKDNDNDDSSFDDSESLEIIMPSAPTSDQACSDNIDNNTNSDNIDKKITLSDQAKPPDKKRKHAWDALSESDDDDDEILAVARATLARRRPPPKKTTTTKKSAITTTTTRKTTSANPKRAKQPPSSNESPDDQPQTTTTTKTTTTTTTTTTSSQRARLQKKQQTQQRKEQEKLARTRQREEQRQAKERQKQIEKETKQRQKQEANQANGTYAHQEIVVLMDTDIYNHSEYALVETFSDDFLLHSYTSALTCPKAVQWIRKEFLSGGAEAALKGLENHCGHDNDNQYEHLSHVMLILEPDDFLPLLQRIHHDEDSDFPALHQWLDSFISRWKHIWNTTKEPKLMILLHKIPEALDRIWVNHRRQTKKKDNDTIPSPPTEWEFQDAIQWLLIQFQVECVLCPTIESIQSNFHKLTRGLAEAPYVDQVTELECIKKIKQTTSNNNNDNNDFNKAKDVWTRQLQMLPGISEPMARHFTQAYPTMQSLWHAYQELNCHDHDNHHERSRQLVAGEFTNTRRQVKVSESLYRVMTSNNPNEMII